MASGNIAVIGGTGFEQLPPEIWTEQIEVRTRFGRVPLLSLSDNYVEPFKLFFLSRHGAEHGLAPHQINYRANIAALAELNVTSVFATNAVGSLRQDLTPGSLVLFNDFLDFTCSRPLTYFAEGEVWKHVDFSEAYSPRLRAVLQQAAEKLRLPIHAQATYVCVDGPRFESPAEIRMFASLGGDVVGMTGLPELVFAREAGMEYAGLGIITNFGAGLTAGQIDHEANAAISSHLLPEVREMLLIACGLFSGFKLP